MRKSVLFLNSKLKIKNSKLHALCAAAAAMLLAGAAFAVSTAFWEISGAPALEKGEFEGVLLSSEGFLALAPEFEVLHETENPILLSLALSPDGKFLFYGDASSASVWRLDLAKKRSELWFTSAEAYAKALLAVSDREIWVATAPHGALYRVADAGLSEKVFSPEEEYFWALARAEDGGIYAGVGSPGRVYKVDPKSGEAKLVFETSDAYVTALAAAGRGTVLAGTYNEAVVLRVKDSGEAFALHDSDLAQITAIRVAPGGALYVAAASVEEAAPRTQPSAPSPGQQGVQGGFTEEVTVTASPPVRRKMESRVYRVTPDGAVERLADFPDATVYDLALTGDGAVVVAAGEPARLYEIRGRERALLAEFEANQASALLARDGTLYAATSNPGRIYRAAPRSRAEGAYVSEVRDMESQARLGEVSFVAETPEGTGVEIFVRSGSVRQPDSTWSEWKGPFTNPKGEATGCPPARFAQWKAVLKSRRLPASPVLKQVTVAALPFNLPPEVAHVQIHDPGVIFAPQPGGEDAVERFLSGRETVLQRGPALQAGRDAGGRRIFKRGMRTIQWFARDPHGDTLEYRLYYRREGSENWILLKDDLRETMWSWDTVSAADGMIQVKVAASDAPSNYLDLAREAERASAFFVVDNAAPEIKVETWDGTALRFRVRDAWSPLEEVQVSFRAGEWRAVAPLDGVLDGLEETFEIAAPEGAEGSPGIRAIDRSNNIRTLYAAPLKK